ncbi:MAG: hypothetical protein N3A02_08255, partial [Rectinema sp.]|nr:hypothetical protein [Rectinema sp.]
MRIGSFMPVRSVWAPVLKELEHEFPQHEWFNGLVPDSPEIPSLDIIIAGRLPQSVFEHAVSLKAIFQPF